jgi:hypothetical protein
MLNLKFLRALRSATFLKPNLIVAALVLGNIVILIVAALLLESAALFIAAPS